jgi:hypothetical protein
MYDTFPLLKKEGKVWIIQVKCYSKSKLKINHPDRESIQLFQLF